MLNRKRNLINKFNFELVYSKNCEVYTNDTHEVNLPVLKQIYQLKSSIVGLPTLITLHCLYDYSCLDLRDSIEIYIANRKIFEGELTNTKEFKILLKLLNIQYE